MTGKQDTGSEFQSKAVYVGKNWISTARYFFLLWGQIQYKDVNEQRNMWCGQRYG